MHYKSEENLHEIISVESERKAILHCAINEVLKGAKKLEYLYPILSNLDHKLIHSRNTFGYTALDKVLLGLNHIDLEDVSGKRLRQHRNVMLLLWQMGAELNLNDNSLYHISTVQDLLEIPVKIDDFNIPELQYKTKCPKTIRMLHVASLFVGLANGIDRDINKYGVTDKGSGNVKLLRDGFELIYNAQYQSRANPNFDVLHHLTTLRSAAGHTVLHYIACMDHLQTLNPHSITSAITLLVDAGIDVDIHSDKASTTALMVASRYGNVEAINALSKCGALINIPNWNCETALHTAAKYSQVDATSLLLAHRASIDVQDRDGITPLMIACKRGCVALVSKLINAHANLEVYDSEGKTALIYASISGDAQCISRLVKAGANVMARDNFNVTPYKYALGSGNTNAEALLKNIVHEQVSKNFVANL